jgi:hypothetical protein
MKNINDLTGVDFEECVDPVTDQLTNIPQIAVLVEKVEEIAKLFYNGSFVSTNFITYLSYYLRRNTIDNTMQQLETFGAQVLSNINLKLNE